MMKHITKIIVAAVCAVMLAAPVAAGCQPCESTGRVIDRAGDWQVTEFANGIRLEPQDSYVSRPLAKNGARVYPSVDCYFGTTAEPRFGFIIAGERAHSAKQTVNYVIDEAEQEVHNTTTGVQLVYEGHGDAVLMETATLEISVATMHSAILSPFNRDENYALREAIANNNGGTLRAAFAVGKDWDTYQIFNFSLNGAGDAFLLWRNACGNANQ